jgi:hypothetical protein
VRGVDTRRLADLGVEPGLLVDLPDHRVTRVLAVVEAAARQGPQLVGGDARCEPGQQDRPVADDDGVRRDALSSWEVAHA